MMTFWRGELSSGETTTRAGWCWTTSVPMTPAYTSAGWTLPRLLLASVTFCWTWLCRRRSRRLRMSSRRRSGWSWAPTGWGRLSPSPARCWGGGPGPASPGGETIIWWTTPSPPQPSTKSPINLSSPTSSGQTSTPSSRARPQITTCPSRFQHLSNWTSHVTPDIFIITVGQPPPSNNVFILIFTFVFSTWQHSTFVFKYRRTPPVLAFMFYLSCLHWCEENHYYFQIWIILFINFPFQITYSTLLADCPR